ncbi:MAG: TetR/AcrR family transcriptional regulator [Oscillospiraceae bacterium]|nr:TetR/AcrR family transcriptional regulator [Oscillospiraceae bacterium]
MTFEKFEKLPKEKQERILSVGIKEFSIQTYKDVSTDNITKKCGISKGILFHYFGSKKDFYIYCLEKAMERLTEKTQQVESADFYEILFESMSRKIAVCMKYKNEMLMVNMATRDASADVARAKQQVIARYKANIQAQSVETLSTAVASLEIKQGADKNKVVQGLYIYINAVINRYLLEYQNTPEKFFQNSEEIKKEIKEYMDIMLYGVCE